MPNHEAPNPVKRHAITVEQENFEALAFRIDGMIELGSKLGIADEVENGGYCFPGRNGKPDHRASHSRTFSTGPLVVVESDPEAETAVIGFAERLVSRLATREGHKSKYHKYTRYYVTQHKTNRQTASHLEAAQSKLLLPNPTSESKQDVLPSLDPRWTNTEESKLLHPIRTLFRGVHAKGVGSVILHFEQVFTELETAAKNPTLNPTLNEKLFTH